MCAVIEALHLFRLVGSIVVTEFRVLLEAFVVVRPSLVGSHDVAVPAVCRRPVEDVVEFNVLRVIRAFQEVQDPYLNTKQKVVSENVPLPDDGQVWPKLVAMKRSQWNIKLQLRLMYMCVSLRCQLYFVVMVGLA